MLCSCGQSCGSWLRWSFGSGGDGSCLVLSPTGLNVNLGVTVKSCLTGAGQRLIREGAGVKLIRKSSKHKVKIK